MKEIMSDPGEGRDIEIKMTDPRWMWKNGWVKMVWKKLIDEKTKIEIHYVAQWKNGKIIAIDDFKFKDNIQK